MWWILGAIGGLYVTYKVLLARQSVIDNATTNLKIKITRLREKARKGDREALIGLRSLDSLVNQMERESSSIGDTIIASLKYDGLYPPSAI
jgi:hypothetical protein